MKSSFSKLSPGVLSLLLFEALWYCDGFLAPLPSRSNVLVTQNNQNAQVTHPKKVQRDSLANTAESSVDDGDESVGIISNPPLQEGSHDELMYALGVNLARQLGDITPLVDDGRELAQVAKGLLDTVIGRFTAEGQRELLLRRGSELNTMVVQRATAVKEKLEKAGREMLAEMSETEGALTLESGVVMIILEHGPSGPGRGVRPTKASTVKINYHGTLLVDGSVFDSTLATGEPARFPLAAVIPGWRDAVLRMHEGEIAMVGIPPEQAYGDTGTPDGRIPGGSTLLFKIELIEVMSAGIGGEPSLLSADGAKLGSQKKSTANVLLGSDGKPLS